MADFFYEQGLQTKNPPMTKIFGLGEVSATQLYDLGSETIDSTKGTVYKYVVSAAAIAANDVVAISDPTAFSVFTAPATALGVASRIGVAPKAFTAANQFGWVAVYGITPVKTSTVGLAFGDLLAPDLGNTGQTILVTVSNPPTQAEVVASNSIMGVALGAEVAGVVNIFLR